MNSYLEDPLVSIGLPTYNRPELLHKALASLTAQSWVNIEIIVADNASSDLRVKEVIDCFAAKDNRIKSITHLSNIGAVENFLFVLQEAMGSFYMWAADDDEWEPDFIENLIANIDDSGLVMTNFETVFHLRKSVVRVDMPSLSSEISLEKNVVNFFGNLQPSLIYGLYQTKALRDCIPKGIFDFWDCALVFTVLMRYGVKTLSGYKYRAGIYNEKYQIKLVKPENKRLSYVGFAYILFSEIWSSRKISKISKCRLLYQSIKLILSIRSHLDPLVKLQFARGR